MGAAVKRVSPGGPSGDGGGGRKGPDKARIRAWWTIFGFVVLAVAFMWASSLYDNYKSSRAALEESYAARIAAAAYRPDSNGWTEPERVRAQADGIDMAEAAAEVAGFQNHWSELAGTPFDDYDAWEAEVLDAWADMETWFPNEWSGSWYVWSRKNTSASWEGYASSDAAGYPMGIWTCRTDGGTLLAYAMAWYAGDHSFSGTIVGTTPAGALLMSRDEEEDVGPDDDGPGGSGQGGYDSDGPGAGRDSVDEHIQNAFDILEGLGYTHDWYDEMARQARERQAAEGGS